MIYFIRESDNENSNTILDTMREVAPNLIVYRGEYMTMLLQDEIYQTLLALNDTVYYIDRKYNYQIVSEMRRTYKELLQRNHSLEEPVSNEILRAIGESHPYFAVSMSVHARKRWKKNEEEMLLGVAEINPSYLKEYITVVDYEGQRMPKKAEEIIEQFAAYNTAYAISLTRHGIPCTAELERVFSDVNEATTYCVALKLVNEGLEQRFDTASLHSAVYYSKHLKRRLPRKSESSVMSIAEYANDYIVNAIMRRSDFESILSELNLRNVTSETALKVAATIGLHDNEILNSIIAKNGSVSSRYATQILKSRFYMGERMIFTSAKRFFKYTTQLNIRIKEHEHILLTAPKMLSEYVAHFELQDEYKHIIEVK